MPFDHPIPGDCDAGHYCELGAEYSNPTAQGWGYLCPAGHYCPQGTPTPQDCPKGTYQPELAKENPSDCVDCEPGYYCLTTGSPNVTDLCMPGYYCIRGAEDPNPTGGCCYL